MSSSLATNSTFATMRAKISVGTHYAVNHMAGGLQIVVGFSQLPESPNEWQL